MKIGNRQSLETTAARQEALSIAEAGLFAIDTQNVVKKRVRLDNDRLCVGDSVCSITKANRIYLVGVGKCATEAASALEEILGDKLAGGIVVDVAKHDCQLNKIECIVGSHPIPTSTNVDTAERIVSLLTGLTENDLVIVVVSGGGSTLLCLPEAPFTCLDEAHLFKALTAAGADIKEMNTVRRHLSRARGGFLAAAAYPAEVLGLIFSDVLGDDLGAVASGPTVKDNTTVDDAKNIIIKYKLKIEHLEKAFIETPKDDKLFSRTRNILLVSNKLALEAMAAEAMKLNYKPAIKSLELKGEAADVGIKIAGLLHNSPPRTALLYGGETVVTTGSKIGKGGRNMELALAALTEIKNDELVIGLASDGRDNSDLAGGIADEETLKHAAVKKLDPAPFLTAHNPYPFFKESGDAIITGDTGSNVSDLTIALKT